jgi:hypothetical protein
LVESQRRFGTIGAAVVDSSGASFIAPEIACDIAVHGRQRWPGGFLPACLAGTQLVGPFINQRSLARIGTYLKGHNF